MNLKQKMANNYYASSNPFMGTEPMPVDRSNQHLPATAPPAGASGPQNPARPMGELEAVPFHTLSLSKIASGANMGKVLCTEPLPRPTLQELCTTPSQTYTPGHLSFVRPLHGRVIRATCAAIPNNSPLMQKLALPIGFVIQPMAALEEEIPIVNFGVGENAVIRCKRCRAYINPYVVFGDQGRRWTCNICRHLNDVPTSYYAPVALNGVRTDAMSRPELCCSTVEIVAPADYMSRPPQRPTYAFVVELSSTSFDKGVLQATVAAIKNALGALRGDDGIQVCIVTFDAVVHVHNLRSGVMTVLPELVYEPVVFHNLDVENEKVMPTVDVAIPGRVDEYVMSLSESYETIVKVLDGLTSQRPRSVECAYGAALSAAFKLMEGTGGKLISVLASMPSIGVGRLINRENNTNPPSTPMQLLTPLSNPWYKNATLFCSRAQICIDLVLATKGEAVDLITLSQLSRLTGGQVLHYRKEETADVMTHEMNRLITRPCALEAVLRVRVGSGMTVQTMYGNFYARTVELLALPNCDSDKSIAFVLNHSGNVIPSSTYCVQIALLYTTQNRERRIRVHTLNLEVTNSLSRLYNRIDGITMANVLARIGVDNANAGPPTAINTALDRLSNSLRNFKSYCCATQSLKSPQTTLLLPVSLQYVPLLLVGLLHSAAFCPLHTPQNVCTDDRAAFFGDVMTADLLSFVTLAMPLVMNAQGVVLPSSAASVAESGETLLIEAAHQLIVFLGGTTSSDITGVLQLRRSCSAHVWSRAPVVIQAAEWEGSPLRAQMSYLWAEDDTKDVMGYLQALFSITRRVSTAPPKTE